MAAEQVLGRLCGRKSLYVVHRQNGNKQAAILDMRSTAESWHWPEELAVLVQLGQVQRHEPSWPLSLRPRWSKIIDASDCWRAPSTTQRC